MSSSPVIEDCEVVLADWAIALRSDCTVCFLGSSQGGESGCMSDEIADFDGRAMVGTTRTGHRYRLTPEHRHDFLGTVLWALMRGRSGETMPRFIGSEELELVLDPSPQALRC